MAIIGINGKIGAGKDLVGKIIQALTDKPTSFDGMDVITEKDINYKVWDGPKFISMKFADALKDFICKLLNCTRKQLEDRDFKEGELGEEWWYWKLEREGGYGNTLLPYNTPRYILDTYEGLELIKTTPRLLLQLMGTECGRDILHPNIWVNALMSNYKPYYTSYHDAIELYPNWVITDMRFPNELEAVKSREGISIKVVRDNGTRAIDIKPHESETALDNAEFDYTIYNDGTIKDLVDTIRFILTKEKFI